MALFSIIIPLYNAEKYIAQCLESIARQTYTDFEVIIIDDGSTDGSACICQKMTERDSRFTYYYKENRGVSSARNAGIGLATGEWISFVDADDYLAPDYLQTFMDISPKADITFFGETLLYENEENVSITPEATYCWERKDIEKNIYNLKCGSHGDLFGWTWDKFFRASIIWENNILFTEGISFREDEIFAFDYCRYVTSLRIIYKPLYFYRIHPAGLTKAGLQKQEMLLSSQKLEENMEYYSHTGLRELLLKSITDYRAMDIYASPLYQLSEKLQEYIELTRRNPQPGVECKVNNLTRYIHKSYWLGYLYCLARKI